MEVFWEVEGVSGARRLKSHRGGKKQASGSALLHLDRALPERVFLDYASNSLRAF